ncbi:MAG: acetyl-CoA C-acyltransferase [Planctomycetes bacterium]|nr:acetyl-CoA C-acyltransferase [Planctomycetota bacterium]
MKGRIAIIDGLRTPFCKAGGILQHTEADDLAAHLINEMFWRQKVTRDDVDEVIFGNVIQPVHAPNIARVIALKSGLPHSTLAHSVQRNCASGMEAITTAASKILGGEANLIIAGGTESMSRAPLLLNDKMKACLEALLKARSLSAKIKILLSIRPGHFKPVIALLKGLTDPVCGLNMGQTAERIAREMAVQRDEQDAYALESHHRAIKAYEEGFFESEISAIAPTPNYKALINQDDGIRHDLSIEKLKKMRPYFDRACGSVTIGNACQITDGAVALFLSSEEYAKERNLNILGYLTGYAYCGLEPERMGLGPVYSTAKLLKQEGTPDKLEDYDLMEINEAFAAQVLACAKAFSSKEFCKNHLGLDEPLGIVDPNKLNIHGGSIALGHPVGATGARLVLTLLRALKTKGLNRGMASLCVGGGLGASLSLEVDHE